MDPSSISSLSSIEVEAWDVMEEWSLLKRPWISLLEACPWVAPLQSSVLAATLMRYRSRAKQSWCLTMTQESMRLPRLRLFRMTMVAQRFCSHFGKHRRASSLVSRNVSSCSPMAVCLNLKQLSSRPANTAKAQESSALDLVAAATRILLSTRPRPAVAPTRS